MTVVPHKGSYPEELGGSGLLRLTCWLSQNDCPNRSPGTAHTFLRRANVRHIPLFPSWFGDFGGLVRKKLCWGSSRSRVAAPGLVPGGGAAPASLGQSSVACCYQQFPATENLTCLNLQSRKDLLLFYLAGSTTGVQHEIC